MLGVALPNTKMKRAQFQMRTVGLVACLSTERKCAQSQFDGKQRVRCLRLCQDPTPRSVRTIRSEDAHQRSDPNDTTSLGRDRTHNHFSSEVRQAHSQTSLSPETPPPPARSSQKLNLEVPSLQQSIRRIMGPV